MSIRNRLGLALVALLVALPRLQAQVAVQSLVAVDSRGQTLRLKSPATRVVSLSPGAVESLYAMSAGKALVAVSPSCDYPDEASAKVDSGLGDSGAVLIAALSRFNPDLVLLDGSPDAALLAALRTQGIPCFVWDPEDLVSVARAIMAVGTLVGSGDAAIKVAATFTGAVKRIRLVGEGIPNSIRPRAIWFAPAAQPAAYGSASLAQAILETVAAVNRFGNVKAHATPLTPAALTEQLLLIASDREAGPRSVEGGSWWDSPELTEQLRAKENFLSLPESISTRPGPRLPLGMLMLARRLHPEFYP